MALRTDGVPQSEADSQSYIRGAGGVSVDGRRIAGYLLALCVLILGVLTLVFTLIGVHHNSRATSLQRRGVPVQVTVTGCVALASGTGITQAGFTCRGDYTLAGQHYNEAIGGNADLLAVGQQVAGVAVRDEPVVLYTANSTHTMHSTWTVYVTPAVLFVVLLAVEIARRRFRKST
jgi:hypothetical protein